MECREGEPICCDESSDPDGPFCYFCATFFKKVLLRLPLSIFEKQLLTKLNVAHAKLHPNSSDVELLLFCVHNLTSRQLWKFFFISSRLSIREVNYGCPWKRFAYPLPVFIQKF